MKQKLFEIRDAGTCITAIGIKTEPTAWYEEPFLKRSGWGNNSVILIKVNGETRAEYDPFAWRNDNSRTMFQAHLYIQEHFDELNDYNVIDVEYILGIRETPKESEILNTIR